MDIMCGHGCGKIATHYLQPSRKIPHGRWQCSKSHLHCEAVKEKRKQTNLAKYGVGNTFEKYNQCSSFAGKRKDASKKRAETMTDRYGVSGHFGRAEVREKGKETMLERYQTTQPMHVPRFKQAKQDTCMERYGVPTPFLLKSQYQRSNIADEWLDQMNVSLREHYKKCGDKNFKFDGFDPDTGTVYEFYGDYWHGNPKKYDPEFYNPQTMVVLPWIT
jgi:uncharacterized protein involved in high-affinity Fe2+ transport